MSEAKYLTIKLFGKTIPMHDSTGALALSSGNVVVDDGVGQNYASCRNSSNTNMDGEKREIDEQMAKGCTNNKYEEARKQRLEENKKRFEDLGISTIAKNLTEIASPAKKSPHRLPKLKSENNGVVEPRRSSRVRNPVTYREDVGVDLPNLQLRKRSRASPSSWGSYAARPLDELKEATQEERVRALEAAEELQNNLQSSNPSFIKSMVRSHVYSCFWLGLPSKFCEEHLPKTVYNMTLEDENGSEYEAVYIGNRAGLSGGWRAFALDHKLDDGDALIFELIEAARFKIYIVRVREFPDLVEENAMDTLVEEGNMCPTKAPKASKAASNRESESNKTKKPKQAIEYGTKESESSQENLPESSIDKEVKPQAVTPIKKTKPSQKKMQKKSKLPTTPESKGEAQIETEKPKAARKLSNKTRKSKEGIVREIGDSDNTEQLLLEDNVVKASEAKPGKKNELVQDADSELKKVEPAEEASKSVSQKLRKKPAVKYFRKKA